MNTEILVYRIVGLAFLICLPGALALVVLPARSPRRKLLRWGALAFIGLGCMFVGAAASWPGPNVVTSVMMFGGLVAFGTGSFCFTRSFCRLGR